jgi:hypothetical protein
VLKLTQRLLELELQVDSLEIEGLSSSLGSWTRLTSIFRLKGQGLCGLGEDVTWEPVDHRHLLRADKSYFSALCGRWRLGDFFAALAELELFPSGARRAVSRRYRRWALESAAADLALQQAGLSLAELWERPLSPLCFVVSLRLPSPSSIEPLPSILKKFPALRFKIDFEPDWSFSMLSQLAELEAIACIDFKACAPPPCAPPEPRAELFERIQSLFPEAWLEDPWPELVSESSRPRVSYDAPIESAESLRFWPSGGLNIKPSRLGSWTELLACLEAARREGRRIYFGGQNELGIGRLQLQGLAAMSCPKAMNDAAPANWNLRPRPASLSESPLILLNPRGFQFLGHASDG